MTAPPLELSHVSKTFGSGRLRSRSYLVGGSQLRRPPVVKRHAENQRGHDHQATGGPSGADGDFLLRGEIVLRPVRGIRLVGVLAVGGLVLAAAACGKPPATNNGASSGASAGGKAAHACMVTDIGGINDRSFNAAAWAGMQAAKAKNSNIKVDYTQSGAEADYGPNLNGYVQQGLNFITFQLPKIGNDKTTYFEMGGLEMYVQKDKARMAATAQAIKWLSDNSFLWTTKGRGGSPRKSILARSDYKDAGHPWKVRGPFIDGLPNAVVGEIPVAAGDDFTIYTGSGFAAKTMDAVWAKQSTIDDSIQTLAKKWQEDLDAG